MSALEQAEQYVNDLETKKLTQMVGWSSEAAHRKEKCGCPSCKKEAESARIALENELERLRPPIR